MDGLRELALFAGAGGGILGGKLLGWRTVCAVEYEPYAASVLAARQNDGILDPFPIWDDVRTFDGRPWRNIVDVVSGGFPCQDISVAGKGAGIGGAQSGMWSEMFRIVCEIQPRITYIENSPALTLRGLDRVLCDLASVGLNARWGVVSAANTGAAHLRERIWIVAYSDSDGLQGWPDTGSSSKSWEGPGKRVSGFLPPSAWVDKAISGGFRKPDGVAGWVDRLSAIGNGQVPAVAATAFRILAGKDF